MTMQVKIVILLAVMVIPAMTMKSKGLARLRSDPLSKTRCDLMCMDATKDSKSQCRSQCRNKQLKPGTCPASDSPKWAVACVQACNSDAQCDGIQRCCNHGCGATCSEPIDLLTLPGLPALPVIEEPKEKRRSVQIRWTDGVGDHARAVTGRMLYILEEQHHLGPKYEEARLGEWSLLLRTNKTKVNLRNVLKPGRWYRFRAAAVSATGTRGFSSPSTAFTPRRGPRPPASPKKLRVKPLRSDNGTMTIRLEWREPRSDLPVMKYKVFWSRRVRGLNGELDSVLVNHQTVPKEKTYVDIKDLQPNSMYFLQVQTVSQFGLGRLRSDKAAIFYNTTKADETPQEMQKRDHKITGLKLNHIIWYDNKLKARISWNPIRNNDKQSRRYFVHWKTTQCESSPNKEFSATTEQSSFDIYELVYNCNYKVNVNRLRKSKQPDSELIVHIPACEHFQRKLKSNNFTTLNCDT